MDITNSVKTNSLRMITITAEFCQNARADLAAIDIDVNIDGKITGLTPDDQKSGIKTWQTHTITS